MDRIATVRALVEPHLDRIFDGGLRALVEDDDACAGFCRNASRELVERVGRGDLLYLDFVYGYCRPDGARGMVEDADPLPTWTRCYQWGHPEHDSGHVVAVIDGVIVDLTARQFRRDLPFPMFVDVSQASGEGT
jgi:PAS domain-containing protein